MRHLDHRLHIALAAVLTSLGGCYSADYGSTGPSADFHLVSGDQQTLAPNGASAPLIAEVRGPYDQGVPGRIISWTLTSGPGSVTPAADTTAADGLATATYHASGDTGTAVVTARLAGSDPVRFTLHVTAPAPVPSGRILLRLGGNNQTVAVNDTSILLTLLVQDTLHAPIPGLVVDWGVLTGPGGVDAEDTTDADGLATTRYIATADTGSRVVLARVGLDSLRFALRVARPCPVGALAVGQVIDAVFPDGPCPHQELEMTLVAGQAYFISETHHPDPAHNNVDLVDPLMTLWQAFDPRPVRIDRSAFLAFSDDENGDLNSALFFVAPASGTYRLVAGSFANMGFGGYRLTLQNCPVIAATADTGTQSYALPAIPPGTCRRDLPGGTRGYRFLSVPVALGEELHVTVTSPDFTPVWELFTNWDPYESGQGPAIGNGVTRLAVPSVTGLATIAIAGNAENAAGNFTVTLTRTVAAAPPAARWPGPKLRAR